MSHYFQTPTEPAREHTIDVTIWGRHYSLTTSDGVFSMSRLDKGTAVLLNELDPPNGLTEPAVPGEAVAAEPPTTCREPRTFLDLGCGYGPICCALADQVPQARVIGVDVNDQAIRLANLNARRLGLTDRLMAMRPEEVDPAQRFDEIWSNPPIRIGKAALHEMLLTWFDHLTDAGVAHLVVGKNLGADSLARWLNEQGWPTQRVASSKGFRVLDVRRGRDAPSPGGNEPVRQP